MTKVIKVKAFKKYTYEQAFTIAHKKANEYISKMQNKGWIAEITSSGQYFNHVRVYIEIYKNKSA